MKKIKSSTLIYLSCFFFTAKIMPSPAYILPIAIIIFNYILERTKISLKYLLLSIILLFFIALTSVNIYHPATLLAIGSLALIPYVKNQKNLQELANNSAQAYKLILIFFSFETFFRIVTPKLFSTAPELVEFYLTDADSDKFYAYKFGSFAFVDSNLSGICLIIALGLGINLLRINSISKNFLFYNTFLIILTFSRSAYIGVILLFIMAFNKNKILKFAFLFSTILATVLFLTSSRDASLGTKFSIYHDFLSAINESDISSLILGKGFGWFIDYNGLAAHSIVVQSIIEGGLIFTAIFLFTCFIYGAFSSQNDFYTFLSVFIPSLSVSVYVFFPAWFITIAINSYLNNIHKKYLE